MRNRDEDTDSFRHNKRNNRTAGQRNGGPSLDQILTQRPYPGPRRTEAVRSRRRPRHDSSSGCPASAWVDPSHRLPPAADHGPVACGGRCWPCWGYRNAQHVSTGTARTGLVLIDIDDIPDPPHADEVKFLLRYSAPGSRVGLGVGPGPGLKVGVKTSPIPAAGQHVDAWGSGLCVHRSSVEGVGAHRRRRLQNRLHAGRISAGDSGP